MSDYYIIQNLFYDAFDDSFLSFDSALILVPDFNDIYVQWI